MVNRTKYYIIDNTTNFVAMNLTIIIVASRFVIAMRAIVVACLIKLLDYSRFNYIISIPATEYGSTYSNTFYDGSL